MSNAQKLSQVVPGGATPIPLTKGGTGGTALKTVASVGIVGSGDIPFKTVNGVTVAGVSGDVSAKSFINYKIAPTSISTSDSSYSVNFAKISDGVYVQSYNDATKVYVRVVTKNATDFSFGTPAEPGSHTTGLTEHSVIVMSSTLGAVIYRGDATYLYIRAFTISGTTITFSAASVATTWSYASLHGSCNIGATSGAVMGNTGSNNEVRAFSVSGTSITLGAVVGVSAGNNTGHDIKRLSSTHIICSYTSGSNNYFRVYSLASETLTPGTAVDLGTNAASIQMVVDSTSSFYVYAPYWASPLALIQAGRYTVSGTTCSVSHSVTSTAGWVTNSNQNYWFNKPTYGKFSGYFIDSTNGVTHILSNTSLSVSLQSNSYGSWLQSSKYNTGSSYVRRNKVVALSDTFLGVTIIDYIASTKELVIVTSDTYANIASLDLSGYIV